MSSSFLLIVVSSTDDTENDAPPPTPCGRCKWEAEGWPEKLRMQTPLNIQTPCGHLGNIPGCYYCGTRSDVAAHTCQKTTGGEG